MILLRALVPLQEDAAALKDHLLCEYHFACRLL